MISSMQWFYAEKVDLKEKQVGPVDETALQLLIAEGRVDEKTLVWCESMEDWKPLSEISQFAQFTEPKLQQNGSTAPALPEHPSSPAPGMVMEQNTFALASLILGICSFVVCGGPFTGIAGIICGRKGLRQIAESRHAQTGAGMARVGLIMSSLATVFGIFFIIVYGVGVFKIFNELGSGSLSSPTAPPPSSPATIAPATLPSPPPSP